MSTTTGTGTNVTTVTAGDFRRVMGLCNEEISTICRAAARVRSTSSMRSLPGAPTIAGVPAVRSTVAVASAAACVSGFVTVMTATSTSDASQNRVISSAGRSAPR